MPCLSLPHYRWVHLVLESADPGKRGGSHVNKQGCSTDARMVEGGDDRWLIIQLVSGYECGKSRGNDGGNLLARRQEC
jgi:hypothetical protein